MFFYKIALINCITREFDYQFLTFLLLSFSKTRTRVISRLTKKQNLQNFDFFFFFFSIKFFLHPT